MRADRDKRNPTNDVSDQSRKQIFHDTIGERESAGRNQIKRFDIAGDDVRQIPPHRRRKPE